MAVYRAPTGNFNLFLNRLYDIIKTLYKVELQLIIYGNVNIEYITDNDKKRQVDAVLLTYNLSAIVYYKYYSILQYSIIIIIIITIVYLILIPLYFQLFHHLKFI